MGDTRSSTAASESTGGLKELLTVAGIALFAVICCAGLLLAGTLGFGVALSALTSLWLLVPTALAVLAIFAWYLRRRSPSTRGPASGGSISRHSRS